MLARARVRACGIEPIAAAEVARARAAVLASTVEQAREDIDREHAEREDRRELRRARRGLSWEGNPRCPGCRKWRTSNTRCSCGWDPLAGRYT